MLRHKNIYVAISLMLMAQKLAILTGLNVRDITFYMVPH